MRTQRRENRKAPLIKGLILETHPGLISHKVPCCFLFFHTFFFFKRGSGGRGGVICVCVFFRGWGEDSVPSFQALGEDRPRTAPAEERPGAAQRRGKGGFGKPVSGE